MAQPGIIQDLFCTTWAFCKGTTTITGIYSPGFTPPSTGNALQHFRSHYASGSGQHRSRSSSISSMQMLPECFACHSRRASQLGERHAGNAPIRNGSRSIRNHRKRDVSDSWREDCIMGSGRLCSHAGRLYRGSDSKTDSSS